LDCFCISMKEGTNDVYKGFPGMGSSYFTPVEKRVNGRDVLGSNGRADVLADMLRAFARGSTKPSISQVQRFHRQFYDRVMREVSIEDSKDSQIQAYNRYLSHEDFMRYEQDVLVCVFYLSLSQYQSVLDSDNPSVRFLYSSLSYTVVGGMLEYVVFGEKYLVNPKGSSVLTTCISVDKQAFLNQLGIVQKSVSYSLRECVSDGQMKIFVDLFKLAQMGGTDQKAILIVGSSSQSTGGSKSYDLLQWMFTNSHFYLYDPNESNDYYAGAQGNYYHRYASVFTYSMDIVNYDYVQDDAFVSFEKNRQKIDPEGYLMHAKIYSCKCLDDDSVYFARIKGRKISSAAVCCDGCAANGACDRRDNYKVEMYGHRQVGKVATYETRVMSQVPKVGKRFDRRFGTCAFCREMYYYSKHLYPDDFYRMLAMIHSIGSRCALKQRWDQPRLDGNVDYYGRKMHVLNEVENGVCLPYDRVLDYPVQNNFSLTNGKTYVFSHVDKVQFYMYSVKIAIYDEKINKFFVNFIEEEYFQHPYCDINLRGLGYREVEAFVAGLKLDKFFSGVVEGIPILTNEDMRKELSWLLDIARFYGSYYMEYGDKKYQLV